MDTRTWTDDQLRKAVASATTWKAVARALGLVQSSTPRLKRHARRLGLETSHFTGRRQWSDADLRTAIGEAGTWAEVLEFLDISDTTETRLYVKGHAVRLGIDLSGLNSLPLNPGVVDLACQPPDLKRTLRVAAESIAVAWFTVRGVPVAIPCEPCAYDLLVTLPGGVQRVQVKSSTFGQKHGSLRVAVGRRPYSLDNSAEKIPYDPDELDYFFVVVGDGAIYLIPSRAIAGRTYINIGRYSHYRVGDASSLFESVNRVS